MGRHKAEERKMDRRDSRAFGLHYRGPEQREALLSALTGLGALGMMAKKAWCPTLESFMVWPHPPICICTAHREGTDGGVA